MKLPGQQVEPEAKSAEEPARAPLGKGEVAPADRTALSTLRARLIAGGAWTLFGYGSSQVLRLGSNLLLTRLLLPEAFGLMALVQVVISGVAMFSDIGLRGSIIHDKRGEDPRYLNTAWTLQILRGGYLWLGISLLSIPASRFYGHPELAILVPVASLSSLIEGFTSTARLLLVRRLMPGKQIALDLGARVVSIVVMSVSALIWHSVWSLAIGGLVGSVVKTVWSYYLIPGHKNHFAFDRDAARSMLRFGRWVFFSTALTFLLSQGDRLILGKVFTTTELGVYTIAYFLSQSLAQTGSELAINVLHPLYSRLREHGIEVFRSRMLRLRRMLLAVLLPLTWALAVFGPLIVRLLYDPRYVEAGWMLRILAVGSVGSILAVTADRAILALGDSFHYLVLQILRAILLLLGMFVGFRIAGVTGLLVGVSCARTLDYIPMAYFLRRHGAWLPALDLVAFGSSAVAIPLGIYLFG